MEKRSFQPPHLLIVEDDSSTAASIFYALQTDLPPASTIRLAYSLEDAREWVKREVFQVVVVDYALSDGTGVELIDALLGDGEYPPPCIFLTSGVDPDRVEVARILSHHPEITFIEKPFRFEALADLIMDRILPQTFADQSYYGLQLFDLIQAYSIARRSATLRVLTSEGKMGMIALDQGEIVHAMMEGAEGMEAVKKLARRRQGKIRLDRGCTTAKRTIQDPTQQVLIEAYRLLDEERGSGDSEERTFEQQTPRPTEEEIDSLFREAFHSAE